MKYISVALISASLFISCAGSQRSQKTVIQPSESDTTELAEMEYRNLDPLVVTPESVDEETMVTNHPSVPYRSTTKRSWDLLHTRLKLRFDFEKEHVLGLAHLKLVPLFYSIDTLELDAKGYDINAITINGKSINYAYDQWILKIYLGKKYTRRDTLELDIDYIAKPSDNTTGGSAAITDDNGLYFIDPRNTDPSLPTQIWSQGETEHNSRWFPTIDKPNERMTIEITLTVPDSMLTLSNGLMTQSVGNSDKTRTDTWKMDQPIAAYLVMIAAGSFAKATDTWRDIPLEYYVEKAYAPYAKKIYNHTPEMLSFFSDKLGMKYPWKKFSQIIVKKYVSGAMENTTAVVFGDFIQKTDRELIDDPNDNIVAHEMFHHWFGDYVTCESWSNLTLNEGFANYSEYLWSEYKYGKYEADRHREEELMGYLSSVSFGQPHDLIDFRYADKENMFDAHSYNKGGLVLHMLRHYIGDDAFYTALNRYLIRHAYKSVEVHDLRLAFEETTGEDLNWFFNQWYLDDGHPQLGYTQSYDEVNKKLILNFSQTQEKTFPHPFILPIDIDIHHADQSIDRQRIWMNLMEQQITLTVSAKPTLVVIDPDRVLLTEWNEPDLTTEEYLYQWRKCNNLHLKLNALSALTEDKSYDVVWREAIKDPFWYIRLRAMDYTPTLNKADLETLKVMALKDPHSQVRASAIRIVSGKEQGGLDYEQIIKKDSAYVVIAEAMKALTQVDPAKAKQIARTLESESNHMIQEAVAEVIADINDPSSLDYFEQKMTTNPALAASLLDKYISIINNQDGDIVYAKAGFLFRQAIIKDLDKNTKYYYARGLFELKETLLNLALNQKTAEQRATMENNVKSIKSWLQEIREKETDPQLKAALKQFN